MKRPPPEICPQCGTEVPPKALACPECGSDYETGWSEEADAQRLDLPDDKFDYDEFVKEEFAEEKKEIRPPGISPLWWIVAIVVVVVMIWLMMGR
jgi:predicted nucleic acid-binding Zn ribbon protein